ncbi:hypothetical protein [Rhodococcus ruber]|uniref:hypothetical protein n=1 Tax=Rhodococcus ruber TaxID=1830 RepID=UPI0030842C62
MSPRTRGPGRPPADPAGGWELRFATTDAVTGWEALSRQVPANTLTAWHELRARPETPAPTSRHHRLKGSLATAAHGGTVMEQCRYEVTAGGRLWYLVDTARRTRWLEAAGTAHPEATDQPADAGARDHGRGAGTGHARARPVVAVPVCPRRLGEGVGRRGDRPCPQV